METILCIDPGTTKSGVVVLGDDKMVFEAESSYGNHDVLTRIRNSRFECDVMAIEMVASYGMAVGESVFETVLWIGIFMEAFGLDRCHKVYRKDIKMNLCGSMRAKDDNIRQALIDQYPASGGGKVPQVGIKKQPGPLYGVSSHAFSALAVGHTFIDNRHVVR